jgi:hypothetical protein
MLRVKNNPTDPSNRRVSILVKNDNEQVPEVLAANIVNGTTPLPGSTKTAPSAEKVAKPQSAPPVAENASKPAATQEAASPPPPVQSKPAAATTPGVKPVQSKPGLMDKLKSMLPGTKK